MNINLKFPKHIMLWLWILGPTRIALGGYPFLIAIPFILSDSELDKAPYILVILLMNLPFQIPHIINVRKVLAICQDCRISSAKLISKEFEPKKGSNSSARWNLTYEYSVDNEAHTVTDSISNATKPKEITHVIYSSQDPKKNFLLYKIPFASMDKLIKYNNLSHININ